MEKVTDKGHFLSLTICVNIIFPYLNCHNFDKAHISSFSTTASLRNSENGAVIKPSIKNSLQVHDHFCHELPTCWHTTAQDTKHRFINLLLLCVFSCGFCFISQNVSQDHTHVNMSAFDSQLRSQQSPSRQERRSGREEDSLMIIAGLRPSS